MGHGLVPRTLDLKPVSRRSRSETNVSNLFKTGMGVNSDRNHRVGEQKIKMSISGKKSQRSFNRIRDSSINGEYSRIVFDNVTPTN